MEIDIAKFFPFETFRDNQKETIEKIVKSFKTENRVTIIRAPVGFGKCIKKGSRVFGESCIKKIENSPDKVITPLGNNKFNEKKSIINNLRKPIVRLETYFGYDLYCTPDHPIAILDGGEIKWIKAKDSKGKYALISKIPTNGTEQYIHINGTYNGSVVKRNPIDLKIDEDLAEFFGLYVAEGSNYNGTVSISSSDKRNIDLCKRIFDKINVNAHVYYHNDKNNNFDIKISYKSFAEFLDKNFGHYSTTKSLPEFIFCMESTNRKKFLKGYFGGDGDVNKSYIACSTSSKTLAKDIRMILLSLGICSYIRLKKTYKNDHYMITINSEDIKIFYEMIGDFRDGKMNKLLNKKRNPNNDTIPCCKEIIKKLFKDYRVDKKLSYRIAVDHLFKEKVWGLIKSWLYDHRNLQNPSRHNLNKVLNIMKIDADSYHKLYYLTNLPVLYDKIIDISPQQIEEDVYDLEIPNEHHFVVDGFIVHNSPVGITMGKIFDRTYYITPQKILQDQLDKDFKDDDFAIVKGRGNFNCLNNKESCQYGYCIQEGIKKPKINDEEENLFLESYCIYKPYELQCPYKVQRDIGAVTKICNMNFAYFLLASREIFTKRDLLIVDEAHSIPDWALNFKTVTISNKELEEMKKIPEYNTFEEYIEWLEEDIMPKIQEKLDAFPDVIYDIDVLKLRNNLENLVDKIQDLRNDYFLNREEWVWEIEHKNKYDTIKFQPITVGRFMDDLIWKRADKIILMSGTILDPDLFLEEIGLSGEKYEVITVPSNFHHEYNPVLFYPIGKMSKDYKDQTLPKMVDKIREIIAKHGEEKAIIHCHSYDIADRVRQNLFDIRHRLIIQRRESREYDLKRFIESKNGIFISINMNEGLDLKDDLCLLPSTEVLTKEGFININKCNLDTQVTNSLGNWTNVKGVSKRKYYGDIVTLKSLYFREDISLTPEHRILVDENGIEKWIQAINIDSKKHKLVYPIQEYINGIEEIYLNNKGQHKEKINNLKLTKDIMRLFGYFISEGSVSGSHISFSFNARKEQHLVNDIKKILKDNFNDNTSCYSENENSCQITCCIISLKRLMENLFGKGATNKKIPPEFLFLDKDKQKELIKGMWIGDGTIKTRVSYKTSSYILAKQLNFILLRLGFISSISFHKPQKPRYIKGRLITSRESWNVNILRTDEERFCEYMGFTNQYIHRNTDKNRTYSRSLWKQNILSDKISQCKKIIIPIADKKVESYDGYVYNIEVEDEESYISHSFCLHNCRYQIILKVPFPFLGDKRVAKRLDNGEEKWYNLQAVETLCQTLGRAVRNEEDWACLYILDESFLSLWKRYEYYFTNEFKDSYNYGKYITEIKNIQILPI